MCLCRKKNFVNCRLRYGPDLITPVTLKCEPSWQTWADWGVRVQRQVKKNRNMYFVLYLWYDVFPLNHLVWDINLSSTLTFPFHLFRHTCNDSMMRCAPLMTCVESSQLSASNVSTKTCFWVSYLVDLNGWVKQFWCVILTVIYFCCLCCSIFAFIFYFAVVC